MQDVKTSGPIITQQKCNVSEAQHQISFKDRNTINQKRTRLPRRKLQFDISMPVIDGHVLHGEGKTTDNKLNGHKTNFSHIYLNNALSRSLNRSERLNELEINVFINADVIGKDQLCINYRELKELEALFI